MVLIVVIVALVTSVTLVVGYRRDFLVGQIDTELRSAGRLVMIGDQTLLPEGVPIRPPTDESFPVGPISDLFVGVIDENGALETLSRADVPD